MAYPAELLARRAEIAVRGSLRERIRWDLVERPHHAFGLLAAADVARFCGIDKLIAAECGVAEGHGLINLCELATLGTAETAVEFEIYGFDTGEGLPEIENHLDHPEIWSAGDFPPTTELALPDNAEMVWGNVRDTVPQILPTLDSPIGFVSFDLDLHSSTRDALSLFLGSPESSLPVALAYFDDTHGAIDRIGSLFRNRWCGQLRAIDEFNEHHELRKIDRIRTLPHRRPLNQELWLEQAFAVHFLDHPLRQTTSKRDAFSIGEHARHTSMDWPL